ncbi:hypothetical protein [Noviherbaspirillum saxi]|nr:hypothetical protein [Noviherbaspirillum saxi]
MSIFPSLIAFIGATPFWIRMLVLAWLIYAWPPLAQWLSSIL